ncbi:AAA family ATPase, partial [Pseudomonas sp. K8]|uniref:AAA family ATPase n=1 Tax=Pseudomonas sp. K8 TaxID=212200 RepID=UPI0018692C8D
MHITEIGIRNFRNFESAKFKFTKNTVNTLIGENASGKTNLFYAMRLVLDENLPLSARQLTNSDFYRGIGSPNGHWIIIAFKFAGLGSSDEDLVLANHSLLSGHDDLEGTYTFIYRPKKSVRTRLYEITKDNLDPDIRKEKATDYLKSISIDREYYEIAAFTRTTVDMSSNQIYNNFAGNFEESIFPNPEDEDSTLNG